MPDFIRPTPQNPTLGAIARALSGVHEFAARPFGYANPPGEMLSELLAVPAIARTVERLSYGEPLTTGAGGIGGTTRPREDTVDAALTVTPLAHIAGRAAGRGAMALGRAGARLAERAVPPIMERGGKGAELLQALGQGTTSNVIKPTKGGNWLAGHTDYAMRPLRTSNAPVLSGEMVDEASRLLGGRDIFSEYRKAYDQDMTLGLHEWTRKNYPEVYAQLQGPEGAAADRFITKKLEPYIRNEMGTPEDPVRALAERGVLHFDPPATGPMRRSELGHVREMEGFPSEGLGQTPLARNWEALSDNAINVAQAGDYLKFMGDTEYAKTIEKNPWLKKVPPETKVYGTAEAETLADDLGFEHLIDELKFSMDPNSGLPQQLRFDPKNIDKLTVPQAVERVAKINAWRAEEAAKAEKAGMMENLQATPRLADDSLQLSFVDKPGGAWVDIPETVDDKGMKLCNSIGKAGGWCTQAEWAAKSYGSGENRLTALVDAEGRPHAQAKISTRVPDPEEMELGDVLNPEDALADQIYRNAGRILSERGFGDAEDLAMTLGAGNERDLPKAARDMLDDVWAEAERMVPKKDLPVPDITELKPVGNTFNSERAKEYMKRDPQYKQKVTDSVLKFLNSGEWGKVHDLDHYDIVDLAGDPVMLTAYLRDITKLDSRAAQALFNDLIYNTPDLPRFVTTRQLKDLIKPPEGFATGGLVGLHAKYERGGRVRPGEGLPDPTLMNFQLYADTVSREMFPDKAQNPQRDAARHLLASALAAQKTTPGIAEFLGKAHEFKEAPLRTAGHWLGVSDPRADYPTDVHNNALGIQLGQDKRSLRDLLDAVEAAVRSGTPTRQPGRVSLEPDADTRYDKGGAVDAEEAYTPEERQLLDFYKMANRRNMGGTEASVVGTGANANLGAAGNVNAGVDLNRMSRMNAGRPEDTYGGAYRLTYGNRLGDVDLNATVLKPLDTEKIYIGMLNGSIPVGLGRLLLGLQGAKTPAGTDVTGHTLGWAGRVGPGFLSANVMKPRSGRASGQIEYQIPFAEGGEVVGSDQAGVNRMVQLEQGGPAGYAAGGLVNYDPNEIDTIVSRVKEEFHG